jgi:hypothetical protein
MPGTTIASDICRLRVVVAFLGEREEAGWWNTGFLTPAGRQFLAYNFQRHPLLAGFTATCAAAKRLHDERIGQRNTHHLFRLPSETEAEVHRAAAADRDLLGEHDLNRVAAIGALRRIAGESVDAPEGPVQVGELDEAVSARGVEEMAKDYLSAFQRGVVTLPYFAASRR